MSAGGVVGDTYYFMGGGSSSSGRPTSITYRNLSGSSFSSKSAFGAAVIVSVNGANHADPFVYNDIIYGSSSSYILTYNPAENRVNDPYGHSANSVYVSSNLQLYNDRICYIGYRTLSDSTREFAIVFVDPETLSNNEVIQIPSHIKLPLSVKIKVRGNYIYFICGRYWNQYTDSYFLDKFLRYNVLSNTWEVGNEALNLDGAPMFEYNGDTYLMGVDVSKESDNPHAHPSLFKLKFHE